VSVIAVIAKSKPMRCEHIQGGIVQIVIALVLAHSVAVVSATQAQSSEGTLAGPDFSGKYVLVTARDAAVGTAPAELYIVQSTGSVRVQGTVSGSRQKSSTFPISTEWIEDGNGGRVKAFFDGGALVTERYKDTDSGRYGYLDTWTFLGPNTLRLCRSAYVRRSLYQQNEKSGCAVYSRR